MKNKIFAVLCLSLMMSLNGCGSIPQTYYYRVDYVIDHLNDGNHTIPLTLGVAQFSADVLYEGDRIVFRQSPYEVQFYHYRRWIAPPKKIVTEQALKQFQASGVFERVVRIPSKVQVDYFLTGKVLAFEEWDEGNAWYGLVTIELKLLDNNDETVWEKILSEKTLVAKKEPVEVVKAISQSLNKVVKKSIEEIRDNLKFSDI